MIQHISLIIREIKNVWNNFKNDPNINQERYDLKCFTEIPEDEVQNTCKRSCACKKKEEYKQLKKRDAGKDNKKV
jgi:hypothetical protein|tara:strand:+ start:4257 stop:4481 length:225 start_codon:yes stop_codon:yes gene_type:complete